MHPCVRWVIASVLLLCTLSTVFALQPPVPPKGAIAGVVRRATTGRPIGAATVRLLIASDESEAASTLSGDDGTFRFSDIPAGTYMVEASATGFAKRRYSTNPRTREPLRITSTAEKLQVEADLKSLSRISGRVVDAQGDGIPGAVVWAVANVVATERGLEWRRLTVVGGSGSDGEGNFTVSNLLPGEYFLYATPVPGSQAGAGYSSLPHGAKRLVDGYYPQGRSLEEARRVSLLSGESLTDMMIQLPAAPGYCAHGTITGGESATNSRWLVAALADRQSKIVRNPISTLELKTGAKEVTLCGLPAEPLVVELFGPGAGGVVATASFTPSKEDRTEFQLEVHPTFPLQINTRLDSETARWCKATELPGAGCYDTGTVRFQLQAPYTYIFMNPRATKDGPGALSINAVFSGYYRGSIEPPPGLYVKQVKLGVQGVAPDEAVLMDGGVRALDVTLAESLAKVEVEVKDAKEFAGTVYLVPVGPDAQFWRQIVSVPVAAGEPAAEAKGVAPGDYEVVVVSGDDPAAALPVMRAGTGFPRVHVELNRSTRVSVRP